MPELPEIEAIRRGLQKQIVGLTSQNGQHFGSAQGLRGKKVLNIWRKAKILGVELMLNTRYPSHLSEWAQHPRRRCGYILLSNLPKSLIQTTIFPVEYVQTDPFD